MKDIKEIEARLHEYNKIKGIDTSHTPSYTPKTSKRIKKVFPKTPSMIFNPRCGEGKEPIIKNVNGSYSQKRQHYPVYKEY